MSLVSAQQIVKIYKAGDVEVPAIKGVDFSIAPSSFVSFVGPSGSGKSTLLNMIGCLDHPTAGDTHSSEANLEANPDGSKMYGVWAQWVFDANGEEVVESDAMARRVWWIDNYRSSNPELIYTLPGTQNPSQ